MVEDEPIVGMLMRDLLSQMGYAWSWGHWTILKTRCAQEAKPPIFQCAVLDVNLAGTLISSCRKDSRIP